MYDCVKKDIDIDIIQTKYSYTYIDHKSVKCRDRYYY